MERIADVMEANLDELAELATLEMGKPFAQAQNDARMGVSMFRYLPAEGERLLESEELDVAGFSRVYTRYDAVSTDEQFEAYVRTTMYRVHCSWWRRRWKCYC